MEKVNELVASLDTLRMRSEALYEASADEATRLTVLRFIYQLIELELSTHRLNQSERRMKNARIIALASTAGAAGAAAITAIITLIGR